MSGIFKLRNGSILLSTEAPGGIYNASQLKKIASLCDGESVIVKATEDQRLALVVNPQKADSIADELKSIGLGIRHYQNGLHQPVSCVGEMCEEHEQDALGGALDLSAEIEDIKLVNPLKIGINGCAKCCVPCHTLDISIVGDTAGYRVSLGGKSSQLPEMASFMAEGIPPEEMPRLIKSVIELYKSHAQEGETLQELIDREGSGIFIQALAPWSQDAADSEDPFAKTGASTVDVESEAALDSGEITSEMATIDDENTIHHDQLSGSEGDELVLDDTPLEVEDLNQEREFNLAANEQNPMAVDLEEIPVDSSSGSQDMNVPIDTSSSEVPEINLVDIELVEDQFTDDFSENGSDALAELSENTLVEAIGVEGLDHMQEAQINAEDAFRTNHAPNATAAQEFSEPTPKAEDNESEDEGLVEARLSAGIVAQHDLMSGDDNDDLEGDASVELLESSEVTLDAADDMSELEPELIPEDEVPMEAHDISGDGAGDGHDDDHDDEIFDVHDHLPLSEVVATRKIQPGKAMAATKSWAIASFDTDDQGLPVITWSNGMALTLTAEVIGNGSLRIGGHELRITPKDSGIQVEVDGMKMFLPVAA